MQSQTKTHVGAYSQVRAARVTNLAILHAGWVKENMGQEEKPMFFKH